MFGETVVVEDRTMNDKLKEMKCVACNPDSPTVTEEEMAEYKPQIPDWELIKRNGVRQLERIFQFDDFAQALAFTQAIGELAEEEDHHPTLVTKWGKVTVTWWTTSIDDLHRNDFIMAARTDETYKSDFARALS
jgi:4a-hydroxytetrahydrobiopterin dehydratase